MRRVTPIIAILALIMSCTALGLQIESWHQYGRDYFDDSPDEFSVSHDSDIGWLFEAGIVSGYPDGTYKPKELVSREQMASYIAKSMSFSTLMAIMIAESYSIYNVDNKSFWITEEEYERNQRVMEWYLEMLKEENPELTPEWLWPIGE